MSSEPEPDKMEKWMEMQDLIVTNDEYAIVSIVLNLLAAVAALIPILGRWPEACFVIAATVFHFEIIYFSNDIDKFFLDKDSYIKQKLYDDTISNYVENFADIAGNFGIGFLSDSASVFQAFFSIVGAIFFAVSWIPEIMGLAYVKFALGAIATVSSIVYLSTPRWYP